MTCETCLPDQHARYFIMQHFGSPARLDGLVHSKSAGDLHQGTAATCGVLAESSIPGGDGVSPCRFSVMWAKALCQWPQTVAVSSQGAGNAGCCVSGRVRGLVVSHAVKLLGTVATSKGSPRSPAAVP